MTPALKLIDKRPGEAYRHNDVYGTFGRLGINIKKVHDAKGAFYVIVSEENLEKILTEENKEECRRHGFEVVAPLEFNSLRTVVVKQLDRMIDDYTDEEMISSIDQDNEWAEVEEVYRLPTVSKMVKVRFKSQQMAQMALSKGVVIFNQYIPQWNIEKEIFVRLTPCRNCFAYDHRIKDCPQEQRMRCTFCSEEHKQADCKATIPKCINCGEAHRTLAATCKVRKDTIKKRSKEIRDRSRSRSRQGAASNYVGTTSYAEATRPRTEGSTAGQGIPSPLTKEETKDMLTVIMTAIVYGHYMEALVPGSFQENVNEVYRLNGLRTVKLPTPSMAATVMEACRDIFKDRSKEETRRERDEEDEEEETNAPRDLDQETDIEDDAIEREGMEIETLVKRHRESITPPQREDKRKKEEREKETLKKPTPPPRPQQSTQSAQQASKQETGVVPKHRGRRKPAEEATQQPRSRASSTSSQQSTQSQPDRNVTREVGITLYVRKSSTLNINSKDPIKRNEIRRAIIKGDVKFTWKNPKAEYQNLVTAFTKNRIDFDEVEYRRVDNVTFDKTHNVCTSIYGD